MHTLIRQLIRLLLEENEWISSYKMSLWRHWIGFVLASFIVLRFVAFSRESNIGVLLGAALLLGTIAHIARFSIEEWWQNRNSSLHKMPISSEAKIVKGEEHFRKRNVTFVKEDFLSKVHKAFYSVLHSWSLQDFAKSRRFISDGVYQRMSLQLKMMQILKQKENFSQVQIQKSWIHEYQEDGSCDRIVVGIKASRLHEFTCDLNPDLNKLTSETYTEYWSFLRNQNSQDKDLFSDFSCPNCSSPLGELGEVAQCPACQSLVNSGDFDWILFEVTQAEAISTIARIKERTKVNSYLSLLYQNIDDFCLQRLEDTVSNAYTQIQGARVLQQPERIRRFTSDSVFDSLANDFLPKGNYWHRLSINHLSVVRVRVFEKELEVSLLCEALKQEAQFLHGSVRLLDAYPKTELRVLVMTRSLGEMKNKGSLYVHQCPTCASSIKDSLDLVCPYCNTLLNQVTQDWIVSGWEPWTDFNQRVQIEAANVVLVDKTLKRSFNVKDCVVNNLFMMAYADGIVEESEKVLLERSARKLKFPAKQLEEMHSLAQSQKLTLRWPSKREHRLHLLTLMKKLAWADGRLDAAEKALLEMAEREFDALQQADLVRQ